MKAYISLGAVALFVFLLLAWLFNHSGYFPYEQNPMQYMPNMHRTAAVKPQRTAPFFKDGLGVRVPPEGSIARSQTPYDYTKTTPAEEVPARPNPLPKTKENLLRGQYIYSQNCIVCHGPKGYGGGYIVPPYPKVPSLHSERVTGLADSQIFHIITVGQNTMGSYAPQVAEMDRWKLVHFVRALQLSQNPSEQDVSAFENYAGGEGE